MTSSTEGGGVHQKVIFGDKGEVGGYQKSDYDDKGGRGVSQKVTIMIKMRDGG